MPHPKKQQIKRIKAAQVRRHPLNEAGPLISPENVEPRLTTKKKKNSKQNKKLNEMNKVNY